MNLTEEQAENKKKQLAIIENMASMFYTAEDIALNLKLDVDLFTEEIQSKKGEFFNAYHKGWITSETQLRHSILQSAINGSSPAQQMMKEYQIKAKNE